MAVDRSELVKHQLRDHHGRWIKMGFKVKWDDFDGDTHHGTVTNITTDPHTGLPRAVVREYGKHGEDLGHSKTIPGAQLTVIPAKAVLKFDQHGNVVGVDPHAAQVEAAPKKMHSASEPSKGYITLSAHGHNPMTESAAQHGHTVSLKNVKVGDQLYPVHWSETNGTSPYNLTSAKVHPKLSMKDGASLGTVVTNDPNKEYIVVKDAHGNKSFPSKKHFGVVRDASSDEALMKGHAKANGTFHPGAKGDWIPELAKDHEDLSPSSHDESPSAPSEPVAHTPAQPVEAPEPDAHLTAVQSQATGQIKVTSSDHSDITTPVGDLKVGDELYPRTTSDTFGQNPYASTGSMGHNKVMVEPLSHFGVGKVTKVDHAKGEVKVQTANGSTYTLKFDRNVFKRTPEHDKMLSDSFDGYKNNVPSSMRWMEGLAGAKEVAPENKSNEHSEDITKLDGITLDKLPKEAVKDLPLGTKVSLHNAGGKYWQKDAPNQWHQYNKDGVKLTNYAIPDSNFENSDSPSAQHEKVSLPQPAAAPHEEHAPAAEAPHVESHAEAEHAAEVADHPISIQGWEKIAGKTGSNPGGVYRDPSGKEWMVKFPQTSDHARNEVLAANLTKLAGIEATDMQLIDAGNGKLGVAAPMVKIKDDLKHQVDTNPDFKHKVQEGFAVDAWLANWDTVGLDFDNIVSDEHGNPLRVDPGGSLLYRAMGSPKGNAFGTSVGEWDTLRNGSNWQTAHVFGDMTDAQLIDSAKRVEAISPEEIAKQVDAMGFDEAKTKELKDKLIARREDVIARAAALKPAEEHKAEEPQAPAAEQPAHEPAPAEPTHEAPAEEPKAQEAPKAEAPAENVHPAPEPHGDQKEEVPATSTSEPSPSSEDPFAGYTFVDKGKTTLDANGETLKVGDLVTHSKGKLGTGKVLIVLPSTDSVRVVYPDGTEKVHKGNTVTKASAHVAPKAAEELPKLAPGEYHHDSASGKSYIGAKDGTPLAVGDRITYTKQGQTKAGTVKAIYKGDSAIAITWDDGSTSGIKKKAAAVLKEEAPKSEGHAPEEHTSAPEAPKAEEPKAEEHSPAEEAPSEPAVEEPATPAETPKAEEPKAEEHAPEADAAPHADDASHDGKLFKDVTDQQLKDAPAGSTLTPKTGTPVTKGADGKWSTAMGTKFTHDQIIKSKNSSSGEKYTFNLPKAEEKAPEEPLADWEKELLAEHQQHVGTQIDGKKLGDITENQFKDAPVGTTLNHKDGASYTKQPDGLWHSNPNGSMKLGDGPFEAIQKGNSASDWSLSAPKADEKPAEEQAPAAEAPKAEEHAPETEPEAHSPSTPKTLADLNSTNDLSLFPEGTKIVNKVSGARFEKLSSGKWAAYDSTGKFLDIYHPASLAGVQNGNGASNWEIHEPSAPEHAPAPGATKAEEGHKLTEYTSQQIKALAKGTEIVGPDGQKFVKVGPDAWQGYKSDGSLAGDESLTLNDSVIGVLKDHQDGNGNPLVWTVHEPKAESSSTPALTDGQNLSGATAEKLDTLPVGTKLLDHTDNNGDFYQKREDGQWVFHTHHDGNVVKNSPQSSKDVIDFLGADNSDPNTPNVANKFEVSLPKSDEQQSPAPDASSAGWKVGAESKDAGLKAEQAPVGTKISSVGWGQSLIKVGPNQWQNIWPDGDIEPDYRTDSEVQQVLDMTTENWKVDALDAEEQIETKSSNSVMPPHIVNPGNYGPGYHYNTASAGTFLNADTGEVVEVKNKADNSFVGTFVKDDQGGWDRYGKTGDYEGKVTADSLVDQYGNGDHSVVSYLATQGHGYQAPSTPQESVPAQPQPAYEAGQAAPSALGYLVGMKLSEIDGFDPNSLPHGAKVINAQGQQMIKTSSGWKIHAPGSEEHNSTISNGLGNTVISGDAAEDWTLAGIGAGDDFLSQPQIGGAALKGYEGKRLFEMPPVNLAEALPGAKFSHDSGNISYTKVGPNAWQVSGQDWTHNETWTDFAVKDVLYNQPDATINHQLISAGEAPTEGAGSESLSDHTKDSLANMPKGTQITYTGTTGNKGTFTKTGDGKWEFTGNGYSLPSSQVITNDMFEHILGTEAAKDYKVSPPKAEEPTPQAEVEDPYHKTGMPTDPAYYATLPAGSTVRREVNYHSASGYYYGVKQADGTWTVYKKTPSTLKVVKEGVSSASLGDSIYASYSGTKVSVSIPKNDDHVHLGTGEIAYVGDTVLHEGQPFKVLKINKTGLKLQPTDGGAPVTIKPAKLSMNPDYGIKKYNAASSVAPFVPDPVSKSYEHHLNKINEENKLKSFAGADAEKYNQQGLVMPHNANPNFDNGIKAYDSDPVDTSNPLYGAEKPAEPTLELPEQGLPSKWDSAAWLEAVKQRYLENPNKAKDSLEQSNKWSTVQDVVTNGNKDALKKLLDSQYVDQKLYDEALAKIDEGNSEYEAQKAKYEAEVKAATEKYTAAKEKYNADLQAWQKANPPAIDQPFVAAVLPAVSTKNFTGTQADWTTAHIGTHTAQTVMSAIKDDNVLGVHGLSFAVDSDQIEHLDVKTTKVINTNGDQVFEFKFKVTGPHGKAIEDKLKHDGASKQNGIWANRMEKDAATGLLRDTGQTQSSKNSGTRYSYTDPETGATVWFQRSDDFSDPMNVSNYNNTVKVHMPLGSTPEDFQKTIANLGIDHARPATEGDIRVFAENQLIAMFGKNEGSTNVYDPNYNLSGNSREVQLQNIANKYGISPDDLVFTAEVNGRVRFELTDEKAQALAQKYNVDFLVHSVSGGHEVDTWVNILAGDNPGLLSTYHRWTEGVGKSGSSSGSDIEDGAGDYVYMTPKSKSEMNEAKNYGPKVVIKPSGLFKRLDYWANPGDGWGTRGGKHGSSTTSVFDLFDKRSTHNTLNVYEVLPKDSVPLKDFSHVIMPSETYTSGLRQKVIDKLKEKGIYAINGIPLEEFILPESTGTIPLDLTEYH